MEVKESQNQVEKPAPESPYGGLDNTFGAPLGQQATPDMPLRGFRAKRVAASPAGFWRRFLAYMLDSMILGVMISPITIGGAVLQVVFLERLTESDPGLGFALYMLVQALSTIVSYGGQILYYGYFYSRFGASLGKMICHLKVVNSHDGTHLTFWRGGLRDLVGKVFLNTLTLGVGWLMVAFHPTKRGLHDLVFDTQVLHLKK